MKTINKLEKAYKTISEVAEILNLRDKKSGKLSTHTIRFWEKNFKQIKPKVFNSKRRYYDQNSIEMLKKIKFLLKEEGFTINGVKKMLNKNTSLNIDDFSEKPINIPDKNIKLKLTKILKIIKEIKDIN